MSTPVILPSEDADFGQLSGILHLNRAFRKPRFGVKLLLRVGVLLSLMLFVIPLHAQDTEKTHSDLDSLLNVEVPTTSRSAFQVSTASKGDQTADEVASAVIVVTAADIERHAYKTIAEALNSVAGFYVTDDRSYTFVGVRGFSRPSDFNNRLLLLLDGHPLNENVYGSAYLENETPLHMEAIERIEIVRGPFQMYGNYAMFAVVNIIRKKGRTMDGLNASIEGGSFGYARGGLSYGKELRNSWDLLVTGNAGRSDGENLYFREFDRAYDSALSTDGWSRNLDREQFYGLGFSIANRKVRFTASGFHRDKLIPTASWEVPFNTPGYNSADERGFIELSYADRLIPSLGYECKGMYDYYGYSGQYPYEDGLVSENAFSRWAVVKSEVTWDVETTNRLSAGLEWMRTFSSQYSYAAVLDSQSISFHAAFSTITAYLQDEWQLSREISISCGVLFDHHSGMPSSVAPRASINYTPSPRSSMKLVYAEGFRNPSANEQYYYDYAQDFKKSTGLRSERIKSFDLTGEHALAEQLSAKVALYRYELSHLIDQVFDPADGQIQFQNSYAITASGVDAELFYRSLFGISAYAGYSYSLARQETTKDRLSNSPAHLLKIGASLPITGIGICSAEARYESERQTLPVDPEVPSTFLRTPPYTIVNFSYTSVPVGAIRFWIKAHNLFDTEYALPGGFEYVMRSIPQSRRNLMAGIRATL